MCNSSPRKKVFEETVSDQNEEREPGRGQGRGEGARKRGLREESGFDLSAKKLPFVLSLFHYPATGVFCKGVWSEVVEEGRGGCKSYKGQNRVPVTSPTQGPQGITVQHQEPTSEGWLGRRALSTVLSPNTRSLTYTCTLTPTRTLTHTQ